jgi:hypothetical protein
MTDPDSPEARARREAFYDRMCWCGHAMGNHLMVTGECMMCDHQATREKIHDHNRRLGLTS